MKSIKKAVAGIMCACMLLSTSGITAFAKEDTGDLITEPEENVVSTDTDAVHDTTNVQEEELASTQAEEDLNNTEESVASIEEEADEARELNYVVVENDYVNTPSTQYVVASIGAEGTNINSASLTYINQTSGVTYVKNADKIQDFLVLFNLSFYNSSLSGQYKLVKIDYTIDDKTYSIDFDSIGLNSLFGVNTEVDVTPTGWLVDDDSTSTDVASEDIDGVIVNDLSVSQGVSSLDVATAIEEIGFSKEDVIWNNTSYDGLVTASLDTYVVVLDPGHGAEDAGATRTHNGVTYVERDLNLKIAQACKAELEKNGVTVYMTRYDNNTKPGLSERAQIAADYGADLFISIHNNSSTNASAMGSEVWVPNSSPYNYYAYTTGQNLGSDIINNLASLGLSKRGVYTRNATDGDTYPTGDTSDYYTVINESRRRGIPGIIIEHAYVSNADDAANFLSSDEKLKALGVADATGILAYIISAPEKGETVYGGVDYSAVYDFNYYYKKYPDLQKVYGYDKTALIRHFVNDGMKEGRQASADFNVTYYKNRYADLRNAYGTDLKKYYMHYISNGKIEGRDAKTPCADPTGTTSVTNSNTGSKTNSNAGSTTNSNAGSTTNSNTGNTSNSNTGDTNNTSVGNTVNKDKGLTVLNGIDYSAVYDYYYYINKYADLKAVFGDNQTAALTHFVNSGMNEGRQASEDFNVTYYRNRYPDLRSAFGTDLKNYYMHYVNNGVKEKRDAKTPCTLKGGVTVLNGVDYSAVYDFNYYINKYPDIKAAFGNDDEKALQHFVNNGMDEGRQGRESFNVRYYKNSYADLRNAFGNNLKLYYIHYITNGRKEGRTADVDKGIANPTTVYNGVDYSLIYDYNYYINKYTDIKAAFGGDDEAAISHFVNSGMREGRQAKASFNVNYYKANYGDLAAAFGNDLTKYYKHYLNNGYKEKRVADKPLNQSVGYTAIMGDTNTTLNQMVAYYKANATYPAFYANSDAPTIEAFCQMYIDECKAEGVRADIAFCQSMKETGFLKYGGQVSIEQYNFAGLGATDDGAAGASFTNVRTGIRAHIQHLKAYASTAALNNECVDPRFSLISRGSAQYVEWLGINENPKGKGWATSKNYGYSIMNDYVAKLKKY